MQHSFDIDIAKDYGILEAILLNNLWFWIEKNKANKQNFYDGYYWTYNSTKAFNELFPYVTQRQIQNALLHLRNEEILQTGNYNKLAYDRTLWYAFTKKGECIMQKCKMEDTEMENGKNENVTPIPDINTNDKTTNINPVINTDKSNDEFEELWKLYPRKQGKTNAYKAYKKALKQGVSNNEIKQGIENYINYINIEKVKPEYIKHGSTWFNGQCWNDDYSIKKEVTTKDLAESGMFDFSDFRS